MNILLVDDSIMPRTIIQNTLREHPDASTFHFFTAENGKAALEVLQNNPIDLIFLDWNMPVMSGEELVHAIRNDKHFNKVRIIMATTEGGKEKVIKMAKRGVHGYLIKPFKHNAITKAFDTVASRMH